MTTARIPDPAHPEAPSKKKPGGQPPFSPVNTKTVRGMLLSIPQPGVPRRFKFQYNPESFSIKHASQLYSSPSEKSPFSGAPKITFSVKVVLEATRMGATQRGLLGIRPQISALETLVYPSLTNIALNGALLAAGKIQAVPNLPPVILFFYGKRPPIPVKLTGVDVDEKLHDNQLNPIHAEVTLSMEGYSYSEVPMTDPNFALSLTHHTLLQGYTALYYAMP